MDYLLKIDRSRFPWVRSRRTAGPAEFGTFFDGIGVLGGKLTFSGKTVSSTADGAGCYLIATHAQDGSITIKADPLGMYPIFVLDHPRVFAVSNDVFRLVEAAAASGVVIRKSARLGAMFVAMGTGVDGATGYDGVTLLAQGATLSVTPDNRVSITRRPLASYFVSDRPAAELMDQAAHEILQNVTALADSDFESIACDLTGGMDSRLVLAAILNTGRHDRFAFHTLKEEAHPDVQVAALLREEFGLRSHPSGGTTATPLPVKEQLRRRVGSHFGMMEMFHRGVSKKRDEHRSLLRVSGGCGELTREFYGIADEPGAVPLAHQIRFMRKRSAKLVEKKTFEEFETILRSFPEENPTLTSSSIPTAYYLSARNRYHFGIGWRAMMASRFHPLYSPSAILAAFALDNEDRQANAFGYTLMKRFAPRLLDVPFAEKQWSPRVHANAPPAVRRATAINTDELANEEDGNAAGDSSIAAYNEFAASMSPLPAAPLARLGTHFDLDAVGEFIGRPTKDTSKIGTGYRVLGTYVWTNDMEIPDGAAGTSGAYDSSDAID